MSLCLSHHALFLGEITTLWRANSSYTLHYSHHYKSRTSKEKNKKSWHFEKYKLRAIDCKNEAQMAFSYFMLVVQFHCCALSFTKNRF
jgi:hypothetical protein